MRLNIYSTLLLQMKELRFLTKEDITLQEKWRISQRRNNTEKIEEYPDEEQIISHR